MVFSPPAADEESADASGWVADALLPLELTRGGVLVLLRATDDARLRSLLLAARTLDDDTPVCTRAPHLDKLPVGSVVILAPRAEHFDWLNLHRPVISERRLKVLLWLRPDDADALARRAPDFYDWISAHIDVPPGVPEFVFASLRARPRNRPIVWLGGDLEAAIRAFEPGAPIDWLSHEQPYPELLDRLTRSRKTWSVLTAPDDFYGALRIRWVIAQARRTKRVVVVPKRRSTFAGYWPVSSQQDPLPDVVDASREVLDELERSDASESDESLLTLLVSPKRARDGWLNERGGQRRLRRLCERAENPSLARLALATTARRANLTVRLNVEVALRQGNHRQQRQPLLQCLVTAPDAVASIIPAVEKQTDTWELMFHLLPDRVTEVEQALRVLPAPESSDRTGALHGLIQTLVAEPDSTRWAGIVEGGLTESLRRLVSTSVYERLQLRAADSTDALAALRSSEQKLLLLGPQVFFDVEGYRYADLLAMGPVPPLHAYELLHAWAAFHHGAVHEAERRLAEYRLAGYADLPARAAAADLDTELALARGQFALAAEKFLIAADAWEEARFPSRAEARRRSATTVRTPPGER